MARVRGRRPRRGAGVVAVCALAVVAAGLAAPPAGASGTTGTTGRPAGGSGTTSGATTTSTSAPATTTTTTPAGGPGTCAPAPVPTTTTTSTTTTTTTPATTALPAATVPGQPPSSPPTTVVPTTTTGAPTTTTLPAPVAPGAYDLVTSDGTVHPAGHPFTTKATVGHLHAPVVGGAATPDGGGYWLVAGNGSVYNFGDAHFYGSPAHSRDHLRHVVGMAPVADGEGYWLTTSSGAIYDYGKAAYCGGANTGHRHGKVVAIAATADGAGYWLATSKGSVYNFGDAHFYGSAVHVRTKAPVVAMAATPDGKGYWLAYANGSIRNFGDAHFYGSAVHDRLVSPVVSIATSPDGKGYWLAGATGWTASYGDAPSRGSLSVAHGAPKVVAMLGTHRIVVVRPMVSPYPHGAIGYDISGYQCSSRGSTAASTKLPATSAVEVLEVVGWLDNADNSCLASEAAWAARLAASTGTPYDLYVFANSPDTSPAAQALEASGPAGICSTLASASQAACDAFNYGYNGVGNAIAYATAEGARSALWWLDVENATLAPGTTSNFSAGEYWSSSTALNDQTIQGAIDAIRHAGDVAGIYSTSLQYPAIAGDYVPTGPKVPIWIAGAPWTNPPYTERGLPGSSTLAAWCAGTANYAGSTKGDLFAGGVPWLLQETPGSLSSPYGLDPDYAC